MAAEETKKKTAEEGKNVKDKKSYSFEKKSSATSTSSKEKTIERSDVNSDVDQE